MHIIMVRVVARYGMKIKKLIIRDLYGYLNKEIDFNDRINLLVGINGSGKTSILNIVTWLITRDFPHLCCTEFSLLSLEIIHQDKSYIINCRQEGLNLTLGVDGIGEVAPVHVALSVPPKLITNNPSLKESSLDEYDLNPEPHEVKTWEFFSTLPKPIVVGLDRTLDSDASGIPLESSKTASGYVSKARRAMQDRRKKQPLDIVQELVTYELTKYKNKVIELNNNLKNKIMISAFDSNFSLADFKSDQPNPITLDQINKLEKKVYSYLDASETSEKSTKDQFLDSNGRQRVHEYFSGLRDLIKSRWDKSDESTRLLLLLNANQFKKIQELITAYEKLEKDQITAFHKIKTYIDVVNTFFEDSAKKLVIDENLNSIGFDLKNSSDTVIASSRNIKLLSSGEQQILTLLTYLAFNDGLLFIIDEPEISLHPKWQEEFLSGVTKVMSKKAQLVIATHSPAIVGKNTKYCKSLLPYNN